MRTLILAATPIGCGVVGAEPVAPGLPTAAVPMGLGVNIHFVEPSPRDIAMIAAAGFGFVRMDFSWSGIERQKGRYDFSGYDHLVDALARHGIRPVFILDYGNPLYDKGLSPHTDAGRQAFARFAAAGTAHFRGRGVVWELWNEPNISFWKPHPNVDDYMALAKVALPAARGADPHATIVAPATSTVDLTFLERCFAQGLLEFVDGVSVHPYRRDPPETAIRDYGSLRALIARCAPKGKESLPILSGEWGYSAAWISREQQGQYLARQFLTNLLNGVPLSIWYDWHDDGQNPKDSEQNFGTVTWDYQPKPAYLAAQTLIRELRGFRFTRRLPLSSDSDYAALFTNGTTQKLAVWTTGSAHRVALPLDAQAATAVGMLGERRPVTAEKGKLVVELSGSPQYLAILVPG
jgi:polysaccharide biosynthesis protein PslG